jgi:curved DNA-binding protein CbpA
MSFQIERGLFKFDFTDYHAILGIPVNADVKEVRKRYLKIARNLHPDSKKAGSDADKKLANQLLSKLVNPAYEILSQGNRDYFVSLGHMGRRLAAEGGKISIASEAAKQLARSGANLDNAYKSSLQSIATIQYESLDQALEKIAEISELNLVYLMLKGGKGEGIKTASGKTPTAASAADGKIPASTSPQGASGGSSSKGPESYRAARVDDYIRRAEGYMAKDKNNFAAAVLELREALKLDQRNSTCHSLLGIAYLKQNQPGMARVHINQALQLNPQDEKALKAKEYLERLAQKNTGGQKNTGAKPTVPPKPDKGKSPDNPSGGLFGGLFGGKKK